MPLFQSCHALISVPVVLHLYVERGRWESAWTDPEILMPKPDRRRSLERRYKFVGGDLPLFLDEILQSVILCCVLSIASRHFFAVSVVRYGICIAKGREPNWLRGVRFKQNGNVLTL